MWTTSRTCSRLLFDFVDISSIIAWLTFLRRERISCWENVGFDEDHCKCYKVNELFKALHNVQTTIFVMWLLWYCRIPDLLYFQGLLPTMWCSRRPEISEVSYYPTFNRCPFLDKTIKYHRWSVWNSADDD